MQVTSARAAYAAAAALVFTVEAQITPGRRVDRLESAWSFAILNERSD